MTSLEQRYEAAGPVLTRLGRAGPDGRPAPSQLFDSIAPDFGRIVNEACFGYLWSRPALSVEQRSLVTIAALVALRRDENLRGHILSGLAVGFSPLQLVEVILQTHYYAGAPLSTSALRVVREVFAEQGLQFEPPRAFDPSEGVEALRERGRAMRRRVLGDEEGAEAGESALLLPEWGDYELEYLWGSVWTRPGLDLQSRCLCTLSVLAVLGPEAALQRYVRAALHLGLSQAQVRELFFHMVFYVGIPAARRAALVAEEAMRPA